MGILHIPPFIFGDCHFGGTVAFLSKALAATILPDNNNTSDQNIMQTLTYISCN